MLLKRNRDERGKSNIGWLDSSHSFSFGSYQDPKLMGFGHLRVINEDFVVPDAGFATHPHDNMEIVSYVLDGALEHKDSMGNGSVINRGDIQRMSAGTGVTHSEFNHSKEEKVHFLQIWFLPAKQNTSPGYEQKSFPMSEKQGKLKLVLSQTGRDDTVRIGQDVDMYVGHLNADDQIEFTPQKNRVQWLQIAKGKLEVNGVELLQGDGLAVKDEDRLLINNASEAEVIIFDMGS